MAGARSAVRGKTRGDRCTALPGVVLLKCHDITRVLLILTLSMFKGWIGRINKPYDEVLGAAQFTELTMSKAVISCHKLSLVVISC